MTTDEAHEPTSPTAQADASYLLAAQQVMERCDVLGAISEEPDRLTRRIATPAMRQAQDAVAAWMHAAGMRVHQDHIGNLIGRYAAGRSSAPTLLLGSHIDTVRDAGKYDGPLGVLVALACVERLRARGERLPFDVAVAAFTDEEGLRFRGAYLGSKVVAGALDPDALNLTDADGVTLAEAIRQHGGQPEALAADAWSGADLLGYCEVHIEQGPVLEAEGLPVGVVTAIQGQNRFTVGFAGAAGHAGTVPMDLRRDALCAAAELILAVETMARGTPGMVATVGQLALEPGASNVIPGQVTLSLDLRHPGDAVRQEACRELRAWAETIATARRVALDWQTVADHPTVACAPRLAELLGQAVAAAGHPVRALPSGAGHDAVPLAGLTEVAMLFVRCAGGISHHPAEAVAAEDVAVAIQALERFVGLLAEREGGA
jgi:allantoate deiminase